MKCIDLGHTYINFHNFSSRRGLQTQLNNYMSPLISLNQIYSVICILTECICLVFISLKRQRNIHIKMSMRIFQYLCYVFTGKVLQAPHSCGHKRRKLILVPKSSIVQYPLGVPGQCMGLSTHA